MDGTIIRIGLGVGGVILFLFGFWKIGRAHV